MPVLCGACDTENRDAAKFCKGCGRKIAQAWPQPESPVVALAAGGDATVLLAGAGLSGRGSARAAAPAAEPAVQAPASAASTPSPAPAPDDAFPDFAAPRARIGNGRWIGSMAVAVVLLVAAAGWYGHKNRSVPITAGPADVPVAAAPGGAAPEVPGPLPTVAPAPAVPQATLPSPPVVQTEKIELAPAAPETAKPAPRPRQAAKKAPPPVVVQEMPAPPPVAPAAVPVVVATPQSQCGGRNIVATAQCMAAQCTKAEFSAHAQCEAVRRQQRLEEEKRNPSLLN